MKLKVEIFSNVLWSKVEGELWCNENIAYLWLKCHRFGSWKQPIYKIRMRLRTIKVLPPILAKLRTLLTCNHLCEVYIIVLVSRIKMKNNIFRVVITDKKNNCPTWPLPKYFPRTIRWQTKDAVLSFPTYLSYQPTPPRRRSDPFPVRPRYHCRRV